MQSLILGGSGSGKSAYAEQYACGLTDVKYRYYLATMRVCDEEGRRKIERHRGLRQDKDFITLEYPVNVAGAAAAADLSEAVVLLECMSNLVANEMFADQVYPEDEVIKKVLQDVRRLAAHARHLIIVTNNIFEDGGDYDEGSMKYMETLGEINRELALCSDEVMEVTAGLATKLKG